jgi:hypothetical protein
LIYIFVTCETKAIFKKIAFMQSKKYMGEDRHEAVEAEDVEDAKLREEWEKAMKMLLVLT